MSVLILMEKIFLYADDLVLIAENELELQLMEHTLGILCRNNKISVNSEKSKIIYFRPPQRSSKTSPKKSATSATT